MPHKHLPRCAAILVCLLLSPITLAQDHRQTCIATETVNQCAARLAGRDALLEAKGDADAAQAAAERVKNLLPTALAAMNAGDAGSFSTISDFLPLLRVFLDNGGSTSDSPEKLGFDWSNFLGLGKRHQHKLALTLQKSEIFVPLKQALTTANLTAEADALSGGIDQGDDILLSFHYSPSWMGMGRDPDIHSELLSAVLHGVSIDERESEAARASRAARQARNEFISANRLEDFIANPEIEDADAAQLPMSNIPDEFEAQYIRLTTEFLSAEITSIRALAASLNNANFYRLLDLVNNQPQLVFEAEYHSRDEAVGPDAFTASISFEGGGPNIRALKKFRDNECSSKDDIRCLAEFLGDPDTEEAFQDETLRYRFSIEYSEDQRLQFTLPNSAFVFESKKVKHLTASAGLGRYFGRSRDGLKRTRVDALASYEDVSDDPLRQDRGLAKITVTYPVAQGFFLSLGAVYATKPEFRGDVDAELSARAGFTYKFIEN